ncbi:hypothetical protein Hdeb2414_s0033g00719111 [Helianthus debilis subsp. tardiflorus]
MELTVATMVDMDEVAAVTEVVVAEADLTVETMAEVEVMVEVAAAVVDTDEVVAVTEVVVAEADLTAETIAEVEVEVMVAAAVVEDTVRSSKTWGISTEHGTMIFEIMVLVPKYISSMMAEQLTCEICFEVYICDNMGSAACIHPFG